MFLRSSFAPDLPPCCPLHKTATRHNGGRFCRQNPEDTCPGCDHHPWRSYACHFRDAASASRSRPACPTPSNFRATSRPAALVPRCPSVDTRSVSSFGTQCFVCPPARRGQRLIYACNKNALLFYQTLRWASQKSLHSLTKLMFGPGVAVSGHS